MSDQKGLDYRWEYSPLTRIGNLFWENAVDPALRYFAEESLKFLQRIRATIQIIVLTAAVESVVPICGILATVIRQPALMITK